MDGQTMFNEMTLEALVDYGNEQLRNKQSAVDATVREIAQRKQAVIDRVIFLAKEKIPAALHRFLEWGGIGLDSYGGEIVLHDYFARVLIHVPDWAPIEVHYDFDEIKGAGFYDCESFWHLSDQPFEICEGGRHGSDGCLFVQIADVRRGDGEWLVNYHNVKADNWAEAAAMAMNYGPEWEAAQAEAEKRNTCEREKKDDIQLPTASTLSEMYLSPWASSAIENGNGETTMLSLIAQALIVMVGILERRE